MPVDAKGFNGRLTWSTGSKLIRSVLFGVNDARVLLICYRAYKNELTISALIWDVAHIAILV